MTTPASSYPPAVEDLLPKAQALADSLGTAPSLNQLMRTLHIGKVKARVLLDAVTGQTPTEPSLPSETGPAEAPPEAAAPATPMPVRNSSSQALALLDGLDGLIRDAIEDTDTPVSLPEPIELNPVPAEPVEDLAQVVIPQTAVDADPRPKIASAAVPVKRVASWPVFVIALPAFVAIWSGWVGLGTLTGFGVVHPLPGIVDGFSLNTAVTLPVGVEVYAAYALRAWLAGDRVPRVARRFAKWSAIASLAVGSAGQVAYHLMESAGMTTAPWQITTAVSCLPVAVLGMGAALAHLLNRHDDEPAPAPRKRRWRRGIK